jgi:cell wall-associated NlpC family hydrolase
MKTLLNPSASLRINSVKDLSGKCKLQNANCKMKNDGHVTRAQIVDEARTWIGTPWQHQGRLKGVASDCVGVVIMVPIACGLYPADLRIDGYPLSPDPALMIGILNQYTDRIDPATKRGGDVLLLRPHLVAQHVAIYTTDRGYPTMIHAMDHKRGVKEHRLDERWQRAIVGVWSYRGLAD